MKRTFKTILCAATIVLAAVSCQKSIEPGNPAEEGKGTIDICVSGLMGEYAQQDGVKSSLVNNVRVAWAAGDVVYVFDGSKYLGKLTAALDKKAYGQTDEDRYAKLGGTISAPATTPCVLSLVHSSLMTEPTAGAAVSELSIDMSAQSTETAPFVAYATMNYTGESISDAVVPFQFATSVIKVNCTGLKANTAIDKATLSNVNTACKLILSGSAAPTVSGGTNGTITKTGDAYFAAGKVNAEGEAVFQIAVPALEEASQARVLTVAQGSGKVKDKNFSMKGIEPATSVNTVCQLSSIPLPAGALPGEFSVSATKQVYFSKGNLYWDGDSFEFETNQYDFPSSWDQSHVGHFYWSKTASVAYAKDYSETGTSGDDVFFTNATETTANANFTVNGVTGKYRTLSIAEWRYLCNTRKVNGGNGPRYSVNINYGGKIGVVLYPDNYTGSELSGTVASLPEGVVFLPIAGRRSGSNFSKAGISGYCWSSSAYGTTCAYNVYFDNSVVNVWNYHDNRNTFCMSVRLVTDAE